MRNLLLALIVVVVLLGAFVGTLAVRGATATPTITRNYSQEIHDRALDRQRAILGPGLNQWPQLHAALGEVAAASAWLDQYNKALPTDDDDPWSYVLVDFIYEVPDGGTPEHFARAQERARHVLAKWEEMGVFEQAKAIAGLQRVARPAVEGPLMQAAFPVLGRSRQLARALAARAHQAAEAGDDAGRLEAIEQTLALGRVIAGAGTLIDSLVGQAIAALGQNTLLNTLLRHPVADDARLARADELLRLETVERPPSIMEIMDNERLSLADAVQRVFTDDGQGGGRFIPLHYAKFVGEEVEGQSTTLTPFANTKLSNIHADLFLGRKAMNEWFDQELDLFRKAAAATGQDAQAADERLAQFQASADWRHPMAEQFAASKRLLETDRSARIRAAGTRVVVAVERYRLAHGGRVPASLEDLGDWLPEDLRADPFTGQPWDYAPTPRTLDVQDKPLRAGAVAWPYTLRSRPMPGTPEASGNNNNPNTGVLITVPIQGPKHDEPDDTREDEG